jgi:hypothetical protein
MMSKGIAAVVVCVGIAGSAHSQVLGPLAQMMETAQSIEHPRLVLDRGVTDAVLPDGKVVQMPVQEVWKPACANKAPMTKQDLQLMAETHAAAFADPDRITIIDSPRPRGPGGLNIVYILGGSVPAGAAAAFAAAETYLEGQFPSDPMTVTIPVSFAALSPGVIGGTSSSYGYLTWADSRATLVAGMDASDTIQSSLPSGSTIPVRYSSNRTTGENRVFWTLADFKANGGSVAGNDASMQYSTAFPFDFDPSNGVSAGTISLQDVIIHETGHALGFTSGVDFRRSDIEVLDVFRFQRTDGNGDYNPDTTAEFGVRARMGIYNYNDDHNFDTVAFEVRLSDGSPYQASHLREQSPSLGIMDPAFSYGETFYPNFYRTNDLTIFDALGYNR